jgi:Fe-S cluster assembly protein SufD
MNMDATRYIEDYRTFADALPGQNLPWLSALRKAALARFSSQGFPSPREEEWKYTNVAAIERKRFQPCLRADAGAVADEGRVRASVLPDAWVLALVDGRFRPEYSILEGLPEGVTVSGLARALVTHPERVERHFGSVLSKQAEHGFIAFNTAYFTDGVWIDIPSGMALDRPIQLLHFATRPDGLATTRSLVVVGENASARVIETFVGREGQGGLTAAVTEIDLAENARLECFKLQDEPGQSYHFGGWYVTQSRLSRFSHHNWSFGGLLARNEIHADLATGCECELNGLFLAKGRQHVDNHTLIQHREPHGLSRETYRGVLADRARGVFQGRIVVHPHAQKTDAQMNNRNLLLSDDAEIDTKPQLEILADDVKCAHGVTVGQLDPQSVFYLESRGVDRESARNMLTFAFANAMIEKITPASVRALAQDRLIALFPQAGIRRDWL